MKRVKIILSVGLLIALGMIFVATSSRNSPDAPKFVPVQPQPQGPFGSGIHYDWGAAVPFQNDTVWIFMSSLRTNMTRSNTYEFHEYLFDLRKRKVVGEITKGSAVFANSNQTKLLCTGRETIDASLKEKTRAWLAKVSNGMIRTNNERTESYWILDLRDNSARQIGSFGQFVGTGSSWVPSPGFRYGFNVPSSSGEGSSFFVCDLEEGWLRKIKFTGKLCNWWDERNILIATRDNTFVLFDVQSQKTKTVFTPEMLKASCREHEVKRWGPPAAPRLPLNALSSWNGSNYEFYFSEAMNWFSNQRSFLLKVDKSGPAIELFAHDFQFGYLGHLDAAGTHYVWNGETGISGRGGNGAVYLRNLTNDIETTLVPPDNKGQYALPRFYRDSVIYFRNRELWQVDLTGSNNVRLFPPPEK